MEGRKEERAATRVKASRYKERKRKEEEEAWRGEREGG